MERTDAELVNAVIRGDKNAFPMILERHMNAVHAFVYRYVRNNEDANDVTQDAFVRTWKNLKRFDATRNFKTWLFAIAKNAALDLLKKKHSISFSEIGEEEEAVNAFLAPYMDEAERPDVVFDRARMRDELEEMLGALPPAYRRVLALRYKDNLKFREIAAVLAEPIDTVKSKHRRGLILLRKIVTGRPSLHRT